MTIRLASFPVGLCLWLLILTSVPARAQTQNQTQTQTPAPEITIVVGREAVRFSALNEVAEWHLVVTSQQGEVVFDSGTFQGSALEWPLRDQQGEAVASGLYAYTLTTRTAADATPRTQRGHVILDRPSSADRIWVTSDRGASLGAAGTGVKLTVIGDSESTVGGAEIEATARNRDRASEGQIGEGRRNPTARTVTEEKRQGTSAVTASPNRLAKYAADGATLVDSSVTESASGDIGVGTASPGGVFDLQRSSSGDILQRLWNTGAGGAKLRYVAATGATSQLQLTDGLEWLMAIAGNNSIGMQFRVRDTGDANNEATLATRARMTILRNGNVGIGTTAPATPLEVSGLLRSTRSGVAAQYLQLWGGDSASIRLTAQSTATAEKPLLIQNLSGEATPGFFNTIQFQVGTTAAPATKMIINSLGNVGIGTSNPYAAKLHVDGGSSSGVYGGSLSGSGVYGESAAVNTLVAAGVYGRGTGSGGIGVIGESNLDNAVGVFGVSTSPGGVGVYARNLSGGRAIVAEGNVTQDLGSGGLVKALLKVNADGSIARCYNAITGSAGGACGFSVFHQPNFQYAYDINFGFKVDDRFVSVTTDVNSFGTSGSVIYGYGNENTIRVLTARGDTFTSGISFTIIVY
ncbi:MAG TPA: hypothetical protein VFD58_06210 [Blastocatellia bacterium]|nr:hypothetical protein [Blastocatellia bacterium]